MFLNVLKSFSSWIRHFSVISVHRGTVLQLFFHHQQTTLRARNVLIVIKGQNLNFAIRERARSHTEWSEMV